MMRRLLSSAAVVGTRSVVRATPASAASVQPSAWCAGAVTTVSAPPVSGVGLLLVSVELMRINARASLPQRSQGPQWAACVCPCLLMDAKLVASPCHLVLATAALSPTLPGACTGCQHMHSASQRTTVVGMSGLCLWVRLVTRSWLTQTPPPRRTRRCWCAVYTRACAYGRGSTLRSTVSTTTTQTSSTLTLTTRTTSACARFWPSTPPTTSRVASCRCWTLPSARYERWHRFFITIRHARVCVVCVCWSTSAPLKAELRAARECVRGGAHVGLDGCCVLRAQVGNFLPLAAMNKVAEICEVPPMRVYEVAAFYTMFNREKVGKYFIQLCGTTPCMVCGSEEVKKTIMDRLHIGDGGTFAPAPAPPLDYTPSHTTESVWCVRYPASCQGTPVPTSTAVTLFPA